MDTIFKSPNLANKLEVQEKIIPNHKFPYHIGNLYYIRFILPKFKEERP